MCGVCGLARPEPGSVEEIRGLTTRMRERLIHRGPDDAGTLADAYCGMGHRRLSIIDVKRGRQPMESADGASWIVYNGEIYNHLELRGELSQRGWSFRTDCDTETLLAMMEIHGAAALPRLRGMFAFALWDSKERKLLLVRDRFGIKPLYFASSPDGSLLFASEIKALLVEGAVEASLNLRALPDYLANHAPSGSETLFEGVHRLPPGHFLEWQGGRTRVTQYWDVPARAELPTLRGDEEELVQGFGEELDDAVRSHLMSDVPLGVFLSGGIDSAAITALVTRNTDGPVKTFSVAFAEGEANELNYARLVAERFGTEHYETTVSPEEFFRALPSLVWHEDEPIAHPGSVPLHFVARRAAEQVKVVLTGEGSDELLAGYARYWKALMNLQAGTLYERATPAVLRRLARRGLASFPERWRLRQKGERTFLSRAATLEALYFDNFAVFPSALQADLLHGSTKSQLLEVDPYAEQARLAGANEARTPLEVLLYTDLRSYLHELLMKQDQMSMAASLESRVPFLDHRLVEFACALPERMKLRGRTGKYILRKAMEDLLPPEVLTRRKMGFPVPFGSWIRHDYRHVLDHWVLGERALDRGFFEPDRLHSLVDEHRTGVRDHGQRLWSLVNLELWCRVFLDGQAPEDIEVLASDGGRSAQVRVRTPQGRSG